MLYVISGPPGAGKSTWIRAHAKPRDLVIDFDLIAQAIAGPGVDARAYSRTLEKVVHRMRFAAIREIEHHLDSIDVYLINTSPTPRDLAHYEWLKAKLITVDPGKEIVMQRVNDMRQPGMVKVAERWYKRHRGSSPSVMPQATREW